MRNLVLGHMGFDFICWWNIMRFFMMFTKIMRIYECSLPWCHFSSSVRDLLIWKMCSFTKLIKINYPLKIHLYKVETHLYKIKFINKTVNIMKIHIKAIKRVIIWTEESDTNVIGIPQSSSFACSTGAWGLDLDRFSGCLLYSKCSS